MRTSEEIEFDRQSHSKVCNRCKERKSFSEFSLDKYSMDGRMMRCKKCMSLTKREQKESRTSEENKKLARKYNLKKCYGISLDRYDALLAEQGGKCAICGSTESNSSITEFLFVDHCHDTGTIRGLLCHKCNAGIGYLGDDEDVYYSALSYIAKSRTAISKPIASS